jgi:cytochrome b involved in lipid metabolism
LSFIAVFSVPVIAFVKKMTGQLANGPKVVAGTNYGGKDGSYTKDEVSKHKTQDDLWLIIDGAVYDVTEYVDEHPGGVAAIMKNAGGDASEGFHGPQHPSRVMDIVDEYKIGTLVEAAKDK